ncbi:YqxM protein [Bacillus sp. SORGH_AS 510]|uniref:amyloid fiber anchoring/assembly protein TapA n=1 Tax=Bacillus sp. SORGH_AS_0510 TaxID=3041771 RepID=UPI00277E174F|nr:amyloid fiber anchoring/assembly protein TapA [Bacillus sp. SORGH_AS_0510]MDQ1145369.1 YqxM protein [Bacillus sp. SORGH_AS_0510]
MIKIRYNRVRKFTKKNYIKNLTAKLITICYLLILGVTYLSSNTGAYYNDDSLVSGKFQAGTWENDWDRSSLKFTSSKDQLFESCTTKEISTMIVNSGNDMKGPSQYEVYYIVKGNPKDDEKVGEGIIAPILASKSVVLKFTATKSGNYKFRAFQRPNHAFKPERQDLWSETITITCNNNNTSIDSEQNQKNSTEVQSQPSQDTNNTSKETLETTGNEATQTSTDLSEVNSTSTDADDNTDTTIESP